MIDLPLEVLIQFHVLLERWIVLSAEINRESKRERTFGAAEEDVVDFSFCTLEVMRLIQVIVLPVTVLSHFLID
jgi:hypothetical protein